MRGLWLAFCLLLFSTGALARDIEFSAIITDADGAPILDCVGNNCTGPPLTLGGVALRALTAQFEDERNLSGEEKFARGELALRVHKGGRIDVSAEDIATIKKLIAKGYGPLIVIRAWSMIDPSGQSPLTDMQRGIKRPDTPVRK